ncbi:U3 small nucleolar RNA-associated protein 6 like protein [Argiope bruennichi]|uniref:U3 small nucleolar RNA-associated protein 6 like protein n=1 Tax=Argiope bruennichi TaxID=94029 RepID=A0A8T0G0W6_ARGBR|nr:U3 small nucleolar RNA-associated protein 6 like protein [Argiope bruennichi]
MAELVHLRLEHTLPELEEMERIGLFTKNEIKSIIKKRNNLEYKLRRMQKRKEDFLKYIEYEMTLLNLIEKRRERLLCEAKKAEIDSSIAKRINRLFKAVISRYPEDEKLWLDQIKFCKRMKWFDTISALHTRLLQVHSKNPSLWIMAAKWEMEENRSPENARTILQRGVLINPMSGILWREYFRMELMYTDLIQKRRAILEPHSLKSVISVEDDAVLSGQVANVVYDKAVEVFDDVEYALSFIQVCLDFDFGIRHIEHILKDVEERFPDKEETLDALAKKPLLYIEEQIKKGKEAGMKKKAVLDRINEKIHKNYEEAVKKLPTEKMWSFYIDYVLDLLNSAKASRKHELQDTALKVIQAALEVNCLSEKYYSEMVDLLFERGKANEAFSTSVSSARKFNKVDLWYKCLTYHIQCLRNHEEIFDLLMEAVSAVDEMDSITLWKLGANWLSLSDPDKLSAFLESGIRRRKEISTPLKEMYLEELALRKDISEVRELYKRFKKLGPLSPVIVQKMIKIEKAQLAAPIKKLRKYYEDGIHEFGSENVDIWIDYMKLEIEHACGEPTNYGVIYWRGKKTLKPDYLREFQARVMDLTTCAHVPSCYLLIS